MNIAPAKLQSLLAFGIRAPSVHNIQPWRFVVLRNKLQILLDPKSELKWGDPTGREAWISLGCCFENIYLAAPSLGLKLGRPTLIENGIEFTISNGEKKHSPALLKAINERFTDRSKFTSKSIEAKEISSLRAAWKSKKSFVEVTTDKNFIQMITDLTLKATSLAFSSSGFRHELAELTSPIRKERNIGFTSKALRINPIFAYLLPQLLRSNIAVHYQRGKEKEVWTSAQAAVLIFTLGDSPPHWLEAGRAHERLAVEATKLGLRYSTSAALVEAADFHTDIESHYKTAYRLQAVMRMGYSRAPRITTNRLSIKKVLG